MRLIYILPYQYPYKTGGAEINYHFLLKNLPEDIDITTISYHFADGIKNWMIKKKKPTSLTLPIQIFGKLFHRRDDFDLIHVPFMRSASFLTWIIYPIVKKLTGKPYVIAIHGGGMKKWGWKAPYRWFFKEAKAISAPSEFIAQEYRNRSGCDITVIPSLIPFTKSDTDKKKLLSDLSLSPTDKVFISIGSLKEIKAPMSILEAFNKVGKGYLQTKGVKLFIAGDGPQKELMEEYIKTHQLDEHIKLFGLLPYEKIPELYAIAYAYIIASKFESWSKSLYEAIFNDVPVIASNKYVMNDIIEHNRSGYLFEFDDPSSLSEAIWAAVEKPDEFEKFAQKAKEDNKDTFDYEKLVVNKFLEMYE